MVASVAVLLAASIATWILVNRPGVPSLTRNAHAVLTLLRDRPLAFLACGVGLALLYIAALALATPPNSVDALWYHLARAAFWKQQHAVGYIPHANNARLNASPPVGEIPVLYTMVVGGTDRFVTMVALLGYASMTVSVFGIARRLGAVRRDALFAALTFATLPVVALQASGALNDLVIGSFLAVCVYFCVGERDVEAVLAGLSLALAFGTKAYAPLALPVIALIAALGTKSSRLLKLIAVGIVAAVIGSTWNFVNLAKTGSYEGHVPNGDADYALHGAASLIALPVRYALDFAEVPGASGWWATVYVVSALPIAVWLSLKRPLRRGPLVGSVVLGLIPFLVLTSVDTITHAYRALFFHLNRPDLGILGHSERIVTASPMTSYYGPLGLVLLFLPLWIVVTRRGARPLVLALAAAPVGFAAVLTVTIGYGVFNGRFFAFAMAFAAASFSLLLDNRLVRWTVAALALPTVLLTLQANVEKPTSVWGKPRWQVQTQARTGMGDVIRFAERSIPAKAHIGLVLSGTDWSYPFFGTNLEHVVSFVPSVTLVPPDVSWLVVAPKQPAPTSGWHKVVGGADGDLRIYKRGRARA